jgi:hypothetical protein
MTTGKKGGTKTTTRPVGSRPIFRPLEITDTIMATMSVVAHSWAHMDRHAQEVKAKGRGGSGTFRCTTIEEDRLASPIVTRIHSGERCCISLSK